MQSPLEARPAATHKPSLLPELPPSNLALQLARARTHRYDIEGYHEDQVKLTFQQTPLGTLAERTDGISRLSLVLGFGDECYGHFLAVCREEPTNIIIAHGLGDAWKERATC